MCSFARKERRTLGRAARRRSRRLDCESLESRRVLDAVTWDFGFNEPQLPLGWSTGSADLVEPFPWTVENGAVTGRTGGEGAEFWQDHSWVETPTFRFLDPDDAIIEFDFQHDGFLPDSDTFLDCLIVTLQDPDTDPADDPNDDPSSCSARDGQLKVFEHVNSEPVDESFEDFPPVETEPNKGYRLRFRASDYDQSASNDGIRISNISITGIVEEADLVIDVEASPDSVTSGGQAIQYDIRVTNYGPVDATNVRVNENLAAGLTRSTTTCPGGAVADCSLDTILSGTWVEYSLTATASAQAVGTAVSTFGVVTSTPDPDPTNETASGSTVVTHGPQPPVAADDAASTDKASPIQIPASDLLLNDNDANGDPLTVTSVDDSSTKGTVVLAGTTVTYDPNGQFPNLGEGETATDTFDYTISDGNGGTSTATVTVTIDGMNDDPVATNDQVSTDGNLPLQIPSSQLLGNDTDTNGDVLILTSVDDSSTKGTVVLAGMTVTYDPNGQFPNLGEGETATDTFDYTISDGNGGTSTATVTVTIGGVNDDPVATNDQVSTDDSLPLQIPSSQLLGNDTDTNGDVLTLTSVDDSSTKGTVVLAGTTVTYDPNGQFPNLGEGETATDTFDYTISDGNGGTSTATVTVTIDGMNDDPVAIDDQVSTDNDSPLKVSISELLENDSDSNGDDLSVTMIDDGQTRGKVELLGDRISYDPTGQFDGLALDETATDTFSYTVSDGRGGQDAGTVTVTIRPRVPGDSNRDRLFDSSDLIRVFQAGEYEDDEPLNSTFEEGDWNGDGDFDSSDMIFVFQLGHYALGARPTIQPSDMLTRGLFHYDDAWNERRKRISEALRDWSSFADVEEFDRDAFSQDLRRLEWDTCVDHLQLERGDHG